MLWQASARAAISRVIANSISLSAVVFDEQRAPLQPIMSLPQVLTVGTATGLAARLQRLTGRIALPPAKDLQLLQHCTRLSHLDIRGSPLGEWLSKEGGEGAAMLATAFQGMRSLTDLQAVDCHLQPPAATAFVPALQTLTQLRHLNLASNHLGASGLASLVPAVSAMPGLQTLDVSENHLEASAGAEALSSVLRHTPALTYLDAGWNQLTAEGAAALAPALLAVPDLQELHLKRTWLGDAGVAALAPTLAALPRLHTLSLSLNVVEEHGVVALQQQMATTSSPLRNLDLSSNPLTPRGAIALAAMLQAAPLLCSLNLSGSYFEAEGCVPLGAALRTLGPTLRALNVNSCTSCAAVFALALPALTGLTRLESGTLFRETDLAAALPALAGMRGMAVLNLSYVLLNASSAAAFAHALPAFSASLEQLRLSGCSLNAAVAAEVLAPALAEATGLTVLDLSINCLGPAGAEWLPAVLKAMPHLKEVSLRECHLGATGCRRVVEGLTGKGGLKLLLGGNGVVCGSSEGDELWHVEGVKVVL